MLAFAAMAYLLLCLRLRVCVQVSMENAQGSLSVRVGALGVRLGYEAKIVSQGLGKPFRLVPRNRKKLSGKNRERTKRWMRRLLLPYVKTVIHQRSFERICAHVRLGMQDAAQTAIVCGTVRTLLCTLLLRLCRAGADLRVTPDYSGKCFHAHLQGIFSCQPGDIMLAALKDACKKSRKTGKEGFKWKSIPLRA